MADGHASLIRESRNCKDNEGESTAIINTNIANDYCMLIAILRMYSSQPHLPRCVIPSADSTPSTTAATIVGASRRLSGSGGDRCSISGHREY